MSKDTIGDRRAAFRRIRPAGRLIARGARAVRHADSLRAIHASMSSDATLAGTLGIVLDELIARVGVDACAVLLPDPVTRTLTSAASRGLDPRIVRPSPSGALTAAGFEGSICWVPDLRAVDDARARSYALEGFSSYAAFPLIARGSVKGVLEVLHRTAPHALGEWVDVLEALTAQAAIAIDNAVLSDELARAHAALARAYDATLEGWARALDLRDKETEGHCRRVTELSVRLASELGMTGEALLDVRRGALLHDIGKMAIPDAILHKPGPLDEDEWAVMRMHPRHAADMLSGITYLAGAAAIPYAHHERWDGTGYPNRLRGDEIPPAARVFAAADLWDALRSRRVYRDAWPDAKVRAYIAGLSGSHLEPMVVEAFLDLEAAGPAEET